MCTEVSANFVKGSPLSYGYKSCTAITIPTKTTPVFIATSFLIPEGKNRRYQGTGLDIRRAISSPIVALYLCLLFAFAIFASGSIYRNNITCFNKGGYFYCYTR